MLSSSAKKASRRRVSSESIARASGLFISVQLRHYPAFSALRSPKRAQRAKVRARASPIA
jgi:hypothetical protein